MVASPPPCTATILQVVSVASRDLVRKVALAADRIDNIIWMVNFWVLCD
jgi:hypothetical protein